MTGEVHCIAHPLIQHKLSLMRRKETSTSNFRALLQEIAMLLGYEVTRDLPLENRTIETPLTTMEAPFLAGKKVVLISVLRAGSGLLDGMTKILPSARVGHVGMYRDHETLQPVEYYFRAPSDMADRQVIVVDPMLATGNSAAAAVTRVKQAGAGHVKFACLLAAPEGLEAFHAAHPDVSVFTAAIDERLNEKGYILPGLGDAGDRLFGTK
ncbi:MAG: uracil phosphoribosyltransferase [Deltaproteobacteria bacterium]|nr:uracil phosphoribosyltransferase [Deltaproteobacteria bacterium]